MANELDFGTGIALIKGLGEKPTDAQVTSAVDAWLDDHPEATTTVEDGSITKAKLDSNLAGAIDDVSELKTAIDYLVRGYITPQMFGAKGDGETDDAQAIKDAIDYALANSVAVYIPSGVYIVSPNVITINFVGNDSLTIFGNGKSSCIRRKPNSLSDRWDRLIIVNNSTATANSGAFIFRDLYIDSNRRNQSNATLDYTYQGSADLIMYFGSANYEIDTVLLENLWFYDGVADHIGVTSDGVVKARNIIINNVIATGRVGTMNDIDFPGIPLESVYITNVKCNRIHAEYNSVPTSKQYFYINNVDTDEFTMGGHLQVLQATNLHVFKWFNGASTISQYTNCTFELKNDINLFFSSLSIPQLQFVNCVFNSYDAETPIYPNDVKENRCTRMQFRPNFDVVFDSCIFNYKGEEETTVTGYPILIEPSSNLTRKTVINNCKIDPKFTYAFSLYSCGVVVISNMIIENTYGFLLTGTNGKSDVTISNVRLKEEKAQYSFRIEYIDANVFTLNGELICAQDNMQIIRFHPRATYLLGNFRRIVMIDEPLTKTLLVQLLGNESGYSGMLKNDTFIYVGENRELYPEKWVVKQTGQFSSSNITADKLQTFGTGSGTTANRPTCFLSPGFEYYDTDLAKMIMWNGSTWVNCDGTALT